MVENATMVMVMHPAIATNTMRTTDKMIVIDMTREEDIK
jgi:hypothetical protein